MRKNIGASFNNNDSDDESISRKCDLCNKILIDEQMAHTGNPETIKTLCLKCLDCNKDNKEYTGFAKPLLISDELAQFLSVRPGDYLSRTIILRMFNDYIKYHNLQDLKNKQRILYEKDSNLSGIINKSKLKDNELSYMSLPAALAHHWN